MLEIILPEPMCEIVPAGARIALQRHDLDITWLINEFIRHRSIFHDGFSESVCEVFEDYHGDLSVACENIESIFDNVFPHQTRGIFVDSIQSLTGDPKHGTRLLVQCNGAYNGT